MRRLWLYNVTAKCEGQTIQNADSLGGNRGKDLLIASTNGGNTLFGRQGNDTIYGSLSNVNTMNGDLGNDLLIAGRSSDRMLGGDGNDTLIGGKGNNEMFGEDGDDEFQFDLSNGGGVYFDRDGGGTGTSFVKFARLLDLPLISIPLTGGIPAIGGIPIIEIIA